MQGKIRLKITLGVITSDNFLEDKTRRQVYWVSNTLPQLYQIDKQS